MEVSTSISTRNTVIRVTKVITPRKVTRNTTKDTTGNITKR